LLDEGDQLIPLLAVHDLSDAVPHGLVPVDLFLRHGQVARLAISLAELVFIQPGVI